MQHIVCLRVLVVEPEEVAESVEKERQGEQSIPDVGVWSPSAPPAKQRHDGGRGKEEWCPHPHPFAVERVEVGG